MFQQHEVKLICQEVTADLFSFPFTLDLKSLLICVSPNATSVYLNVSAWFKIVCFVTFDLTKTKSIILMGGRIAFLQFKTKRIRFENSNEHFDGITKPFWLLHEANC